MCTFIKANTSAYFHLIESFPRVNMNPVDGPAVADGGDDVVVVVVKMSSHLRLLGLDMAVHQILWRSYLLLISLEMSKSNWAQCGMAAWHSCPFFLLKVEGNNLFARAHST